MGESYPRFIELVVPAMLNRLADLRSACPSQEICFLLGTNYIEKIEPALIRKGRIDLCVPVVYPDRDSRLAMVGRHIQKLRKAQKRLKVPKEIKTSKAITAILTRFQTKLARDTSQWPWQTIESALTSLTRELEDHFKEAKVSGPINVLDYKHYVETHSMKMGRALRV
jgi:SpoVK/Ycf46/Vps4 family AAA+-type ATPase